MLFSLAIAFLLAQAGGQNPQPSAQTPADSNAKPPEKCVIQGKAVNAVTGEPLRKADISLEGSGQDSALTNTSAITGADGAFTFKDIDPGSYRIRATRTGFASTWYGAKKLSNIGTEIRLAAGQSMTDVLLRLPPQAVITGRITDADGDPVSGVSVALTRSFYRNGQRVVADTESANTNDLGEYRIFGVAAGKYRMRAMIRGNGMLGDREDYAPTYYPGQPDASAAAVIELHPGQTLRGIDMAVQRTPTHRVRGKVNLSSTRADFVQVMVTSRDPDEFMPRRTVAVRPAKPTFEVRLPPGSYNLTAYYNDSGAMVSGIAQVDVGESDIDNVVIDPHPGVDVSGRVRIEGAADLSALAQSNVRVQVYAKDNGILFGVQPGRMNDDGTFTLKNIGPQAFNVNVIGLPSGYYLKSASYGAQDAKENGFTYTGSSDTLDVVVSPKAAVVSGVVHNHKGDPVAGAFVVLAPPAAERSNARRFHLAITDQTGRFKLNGVEPNDYTVFAWEDIEPGEYMDPDVLKAAESSGKALKLEEGAQESLDLEAIPAEDTPSGG